MGLPVQSSGQKSLQAEGPAWSGGPGMGVELSVWQQDNVVWAGQLGMAGPDRQGLELPWRPGGVLLWLGAEQVG